MEAVTKAVAQWLIAKSYRAPFDGKIYPARNETRGVLPDRTTAVHYVKFPLDAEGVAAVIAAGRSGGVPAPRLRVRHPHLEVTTPLPPGVARALGEDLTEEA